MELHYMTGSGSLFTFHMITFFILMTIWGASSEPAINETICIADRLSCVDHSAPCVFMDTDNENHGTALCSCPDTKTQDVKFCYKQQPIWSEQEPFKECKWIVGGPPKIYNHSETSVSNPSCYMHIETLCPQVGPMAGGTNLFIWGKGLKEGDKEPEVSLTGFGCDILYSNSTFIHCKTSNAWGTNVQGSFLRLKIDKGDDCILSERTSFTYHNDPTITGSITPSRSILSGGINVTVTGTNFRSVSRFLMQIRAIYKGNTSVSASLCEKEGEDKLICPTPRVDLGSLNLPEEVKRSRRHIPHLREHTKKIRKTIDALRIKRQVMPPKEGLIHDPGLVVFAGFKADGVTSLQTIQEWRVYQDPTFEEFKDKHLIYRPEWPDFDTDIKINGKNILSGVYASDYEVKIGTEPCEALDISATTIVCTPPKNPPSPPPGGPQKDGNPALTVRAGNMVFSPGFVHYDMNVWNNSKVRYGIIGGLAVGIPVLTCILVLIAVKCHIKRKEEEKERLEVKTALEKGKNDLLVGDFLHPKANLIQALPTDLRANVQSCILHTGRVDQTDIKSRGNRGGIYIGWLLDEKGKRMMPIDIKTFKDDNVPFRDLKTFLEDAVKLRGMNHPNVQRLIGLSILDNLPKAISPVSEFGDLKSFLHNQRLRQSGEEVVIQDLPGRRYKEPEEITLTQMINFAKDIANGMNYLSNIGFVHEDLAARNCVVDKEFVVKVSDATLSMDIYELDYWRPGEKLKLQPVKWMAPESLITGIISSKSDVWAYGVTLWEIFTLGATPYPDVDNADMQDHLKAGHRLSKPDSMPVSLYAEMTHCWAKEPNKRPHFGALHDRLSNLDVPFGDVNRAFVDEVETNATEANTAAEAITVDIERTSNEDNTELEGTEASANTDDDGDGDTNDRASKQSSEIYDEIGEEHVKLEVAAPDMSDHNMVF